MSQGPGVVGGGVEAGVGTSSSAVSVVREYVLGFAGALTGFALADSAKNIWSRLEAEVLALSGESDSLHEIIRAAKRSWELGA